MFSAQNFIIISQEKFSVGLNIAHLRQGCHNSKFVILHDKFLKVLKYCNFL